MKIPLHMVRLVAIAVVLICSIAPRVIAQDCPELVGRWVFGPPGAVTVEDDFVYIGSGSGLLIADVSNPSMPREVGGLALPDIANAIAVAGDHAYIADRAGGLRVIDVSNSSAPVEAGAIDTLEAARDVAVSGGFAYVADVGAGLAVVDVSIPSAPSVVASLDQLRFALSVAVSGTYVFVTTASDGLRVIDVSTPSAPVEVGFIATPGRAEDLVVVGDSAYLATTDLSGGTGGLHVIDISTPSAPVEVSVFDAAGDLTAVAVSGGYAYALAGTRYELHIIDVGTPSAPVEVSSFPLELATDVAAGGDYAYATALLGGVPVIDVSTPSTPQMIATITTPGWLLEIAVSGGYAYISDANVGLRVIDVRTPTAPVSVGTYPEGGEDIAVVGDYAYVVWQGLHVLDISTPSVPVEVGTASFGWGTGVAVSDGYAYVAADEAGLRVIDVSRPSAPVEVGAVDFPGEAYKVAVSGDYAYVANRARGLRIIDVSTPSAPVEVGHIDTAGDAYDVAVSGSHAYLASYKDGLRIVDVSVPSAPVEVGFLDSPGDAVAVEVSRGYAYVARYGDLVGDEWQGLWVIDVSTPSAPVEAGFAPGLGHTRRVAVSDGYAFVLQFDVGLAIYSDCASGPIQQGFESFVPAAAVATGAEGAFFQTDLEVNNNGPDQAEVYLRWLPRGENNSDAVASDLVTLDPGQSVRFDNVLTDQFGLEPDSLGALKLVSSTADVIGVSRTYNLPGGGGTGTFGQGLPAIRATEMIPGTEPRRIICLTEDSDFRANVGCVNGRDQHIRISVSVFDNQGSALETRTLELGPYSNDQLNRVLGSWAPVDGYVEVRADHEGARYYCYGSMLDNLTSDPTTIFSQVPSDDTTFIPAAALAAGLEGSFFTTDVDLNNVGSTDLTYELLWLPRGADNSDPIRSETFLLAPGSGVRYANVLGEVFGLEPDEVGALAVEASGTDLLAMSRTYNLPSAKVAGTFGQELPGIPANRMIPTGVKKRIIFLSENDDVRANVGCINGVGTEVAVAIDLFNSDGAKLETTNMLLPPYSNRQINGIFRDYSPINGYVEFRTYTPGALIYCYGSVLDNVTSDPTTVLPQ